MIDELSIEDALETLIIGKWGVTDFSSENAVLTSDSSDKKTAINVENSGSDYDFTLNFKEHPKQLIAKGDFSITMTGTSEKSTFSRTFKCTDFLNDLLLGDWGIINSSLYLSLEKVHATILISELTETSLKLNIEIDKTIDNNGSTENLNSIFCLTFARINS
ncbi:MAG: hypothetical protein COB98_08375 [Flavobacteriaceae bacterium]|nr:MAG: hypothetical protein COB98_08375 [Flavobacteriaceae bacterium]